MMTVRFMSHDEFQLYMQGRALKNTTDHKAEGRRSTSVGFCWAILSEERDEEKWFRKLFFNTTAEYAVVVDTDKCPSFMLATGYYADDNDFSKFRHFRELCCTEYSLKTHPFERVGICPTLEEMCQHIPIRWLDLKP